MTSSLFRDAAEEYNETGYVILKGFLPPKLLDSFEQTIVGFLSMQAQKLGLREGKADMRQIDRAADELVTELNAKDRPALGAAMTMAHHSAAGHDIISFPALRQLSSSVLSCPEEMLILNGPYCFQNIPSTKDRLYTWHSEVNWYPKRRQFANIWFPVFRGKDSTSGTMRMLKRSHPQVWDFAEFQGFDKSSEGDSSFLLQYEIPVAEIAGFDQEDVIAERGDLVIFHRNLVHTSSVNKSKSPTYAATVRVFDYRRDLTVSAEWAERPYRVTEGSSSGGRSQMRPLDVTTSDHPSETLVTK